MEDGIKGNVYSIEVAQETVNGVVTWRLTWWNRPYYAIMNWLTKFL